ncbi:MAG: hypothetical protein AB7Q04_12970 [Steroidobacteraceae bacterium]
MTSLFSSPKAPDNSAAIAAQNESLKLQQQSQKSADDRQASLDAQLAARRRSISASGGGRRALLTGTEQGVTSTKQATLG